LFQSHNFKQSLDAYQDCISFCRKTDECESVVFNISSAKASLEYILGDYDAALATINGVLRRDPYHFLSLLKRSQVYKKVGINKSSEK
jgi:Tfp pilus assembly protein PilF